MHRRRSHLRRLGLGLGFIASIIVLATLVTGWLVDSAGPRGTVASVEAGAALPQVGPKAQATEQPSIEQQLADAAEAQVAAEEAARAKAEAEAKAKAEAEARARAEAEAAARAEAERQAAAEEAARSLERAIDDPKSAARTLMADYGWGDDQFSCLDSLWIRESNWRHTAENPSSGAYGIPQSLPASKMSRFGDDYRSNPVTQIEWGLWYIEDRYGTPCEAWAHSEATGWY
ncbi:lytic transglycosylase domain-containing protein [Jiangella asiatica]|uniref:Lytic transglycosylase domain-containing protein n=1 Tax=Jiangella asiatica TaxID=2530372 RepID=A0A4R5DFD4_9ACTN|nr:lytic transglycosylase domain-containing protein [Jiangella asiatica]TDE09093.1 lytic transglycosylase domain-containing protein [Jiangella asiatica]